MSKEGQLSRESSQESTCTVASGKHDADPSQASAKDQSRAQGVVASKSATSLTSRNGVTKVGRLLKANEPFRAPALSFSGAMASARMRGASSNSSLFARRMSITQTEGRPRSVSAQNLTGCKELPSGLRRFKIENSWPPANSIEKVTAIYDYTAAHADELTFREGDVIYVLFKGDDGWYRGIVESSRQEGLLPGNYVEAC